MMCFGQYVELATCQYLDLATASLTVERMQASNVFQKLQPEFQAEKAPESTVAAADNVSMAEKLQGMKDAAAESVKAPAQIVDTSVAPVPSAPASITAAPTPSLPSVPESASATDIESTIMSAVEGTSPPV